MSVDNNKSTKNQTGIKKLSWYFKLRVMEIRVSKNYGLTLEYKRDLTVREMWVYEWAVEMIAEMIVLVCKGCHVYSGRDLQNKYKLKEVKFTYHIYDDPPNNQGSRFFSRLVGRSDP